MPSSPSLEGPGSAVDEVTPLLAASNAVKPITGIEDAKAPVPRDSQPDDAEDDTPLPKSQIFLLCYARLVEPVAFFTIFPFINKMIWETGNLKEEDVGFYTGLIESLFSFAQLLLMIHWGKASDRLGRKPVLVFSLFGVSIATTLFGFSKTVWQMIFFRCLGGVFSGSVVTIRTMISENSTKRTQAKAFSYFAFTSNVGIFLGPFIGVLSNPADQYPTVFGNIQLFKTFPYALPTITTGVISASAAILTLLFVKETLTPERRAKNAEYDQGPMSIWDLLKFPGVAKVIYLYGHVMVLAFGYTAVIPVFWFTHVQLGGYGFSPFQISMLMGATGLSQALWTLLAFPPLQKRYGTGGVLRACAILWPIFFMMSPLSNFFLRQNLTALFWIFGPVATVIGTGIAIAFTAIQLALNDISPSQSTLGTLNGLALSVIAALRSISPALFTSIFAIGIKSQIFWGYLVWVILIGTALILTFTMRGLPEKAEGKIRYEPVDEENTARST